MAVFQWDGLTNPLGSNMDPLTMGNPWMGGNNNVAGMMMPSLFGLPNSNFTGSYQAPGGVSFTPNYNGGQGASSTGADPFAAYTTSHNVPDSISTQAVGYDGVLWNSARSQADYNAKLNQNILWSYNERLRRGENPEDPTPYLWETDFDKILSYGQQGLPGNGLASQYMNGPSYFPINVPVGAYNAIDPMQAAKTPGWDGLGVPATATPTQSLYGATPTPPAGQGLVPAANNGAMNTQQMGALLALMNSLNPANTPMNTPVVPTSASTSGGSTQPFNVEDVNYWRSLVQNPQAFDATPVWQSLINATDEQTRKNAGNLQEYFNVTGNRYSTPFASGMSDYWEQVNRDQAALLGQMQMQGHEAERNRQFSGASGLANLTSTLWDTEANRRWQSGESLANRTWQSGENNLNRLFTGSENEANRNLQWDLNSSNQMFNQWLTNAQQGFQAAMYNAGQTDQSAMALLNNASQAANQLNQNAIFGANQLFGAENQALQQLFGNATNTLPMLQQWQQFAQSMGLNAAQGLGNLFNTNLGLGNQIGQGQYATFQDQLNRAYQEWMRQQPWYHPNLNALLGLSTAQQGQYFPQYQPSGFNQITGLLGSLLPYFFQLGK